MYCYKLRADSANVIHYLPTCHKQLEQVFITCYCKGYQKGAIKSGFAPIMDSYSLVPGSPRQFQGIKTGELETVDLKTGDLKLENLN